MQSRPAWARGLKHERIQKGELDKMSRPAWARGLKQATDQLHLCSRCRAPHGRVD